MELPLRGNSDLRANAFLGRGARLMRPLAHFVGTHALMCFYMTEALPTRETGLRLKVEEIAGYTPPRSQPENVQQITRPCSKRISPSRISRRCQETCSLEFGMR